MVNSILSFSIAAVISFIGSLQPGPVNLQVLYSGFAGSRKQALLCAAGGIVPEFVYCVLAPQDGVVLFDDPSEWIGRPVSVGERILRLTATTDTEVEVWLALADAIVLEPGANVNLYLNSSPLSPVAARMRYMAHDAVLRPDGGYAYRVRASLVNPTMHRVGLKGTAKLQGGWVPLVYWVLRRPLASVRSTLGY